MLYCLLQEHWLYILQDIFFSCERESLLEAVFTYLQEISRSNFDKYILTGTLQPLQAHTSTENHSANCVASMCPNLDDHCLAIGHPCYDHATDLVVVPLVAV